MSFMYVVQYMYFLFHISISMYMYIYIERERNIVVQIQATFPKRVQQQQVSTRDAPKYTECCVFCSSLRIEARSSWPRNAA